MHQTYDDPWRDPYRRCEDPRQRETHDLAEAVLVHDELLKGDGPFPAVSPEQAVLLRYGMPSPVGR